MSVSRSTTIVQEDTDFIDSDKNRLSIQVKGGKHIYNFYLLQTPDNLNQIKKLYEWLDKAVKFK